MNWLMTLTLVLLVAAVVDCQRGRGRGRGHKKCKVQLRNDRYSPFFWKGYENICTKNLCEQYPWLPCDTARTTILENVAGHRDNDILQEIEDMRKYYNTMIPKPDNTLPYNCEGACQQNKRPLQLEVVFYDKLMFNEGTFEMQDRWACVVIGPEIHYQSCEGPCNMRFGGSGGTNRCVPDIINTMDIWVFCPNASTQCNKIKFDVPQSCACKKVNCKKDIPKSEPFIPLLPPQPPVDPWAFDMGMGMELGHVDLSPLNPVGADVGAPGGSVAPGGGGAHGGNVAPGGGGAHGDVGGGHGGGAHGGGGGGHGGIGALGDIHG